MIELSEALREGVVLPTPAEFSLGRHSVRLSLGGPSEFRWVGDVSEVSLPALTELHDVLQDTGTRLSVFVGEDGMTYFYEAVTGSDGSKVFWCRDSGDVVGVLDMHEFLTREVA